MGTKVLRLQLHEIAGMMTRRLRPFAYCRLAAAYQSIEAVVGQVCKHSNFCTFSHTIHCSSIVLLEHRRFAVAVGPRLDGENGVVQRGKTLGLIETLPRQTLTRRARRTDSMRTNHVEPVHHVYAVFSAQPTPGGSAAVEKMELRRRQG